MKKKEVNINEESTSAGGAHAVNKFRISDFVMMAVIVIPAPAVYYRSYM